ncbi:MAG: aminopeptidase P family protein, partial [Myxococcota bacterium]
MADIPHKLDQAELRTLRRYRLARVREQLAKHDVAGAVLFDPINIRYAIDSSNMQVWTLHNPHRYVFVATEGPVVVFDGAQCHHLSRDLETVDEVRLSTCWFFFVNGPRVEEMANRWADEMADLIHQ